MNTADAFRRMVKTGPGETFGGITASKRAPLNGAAKRQLAFQDRIFPGDGASDRAGHGRDQRFRRRRSHLADGLHCPAQPVRPYAAVRIEHQLDDIGGLQEPAERGPKLPAQGLGEPPGLLFTR